MSFSPPPPSFVPPPPVPISPLGYSPPRAARPGILTAVGVISLVIGGIGMLASAGGVIKAVAYGVMTKVSAMTVTTSSSAGGTSGVAGTSGMVTAGAGGVTVVGPGQQMAGAAAATAAAEATEPVEVSADARTTVAGLAGLEPLTSGQQDQVLGLLGEQGDWVLGTPEAGAGWTVADVKRMVRGHGRVAAAADGGAGEGFYFQTADGRLEVHDAVAMYRPTGGQLVTASAERDASGELVRKVDADDDGAGAGGGMVGPMRVGRGGRAGRLTLPPFRFSASPGAVRLSVIAEGVCLIVAVLLVVAGAQVLRDAPSGRRLHLWWVAVKVPVVALTAVASAWLTSSTVSSFAGISGASATAASVAGYVAAGVFAGLQLAYPVAVLIVMNTGVAKAWFEGGRET